MPKKADPTTREFRPLDERLLSSVLLDDSSHHDSEPTQAQRQAAPSSARPQRLRRDERTSRSDTISSTTGEHATALDKVIELPRNGAGEREARSETGARDKQKAQADLLPSNRLNRPLKVHLQPSERFEVDRIMTNISQELGTRISISHMQRAFVALLRNAEHNLLDRARRHGPITRPANENLVAIAAFEEELARLLAGALREAPPLRDR